jgi:hypothetical protein
MGTDPTTYKDALEMLREHRCTRGFIRKKLANNTYLTGTVVTGGGRTWDRTGPDPDFMSVELHGTQVVRMHSDGTYRLAGMNTWTTRNRIKRFSPFYPHVWNGYGVVSTDTKLRPYYPEMKLKADGTLILDNDDRWLNSIDMKDVLESAPSYAGFLARKLLHGKLEGWTKTARVIGDKFLLKAMREKTYSGEVVVQLLDDSGEFRRYRDLLLTLRPNVYRRFWLKPHTVEEELERYSNDLQGFSPGVPGMNISHPRKLHQELKRVFTNVLFAAARLQEAERSGWR